MTQILSKPINLLMALITSENAAEMAKRSWEARLAKKLAEQQAAPVPQNPPESYVDKRLSRVRAQIDLLSDMLEQEQDPAKLDRLANAITRLSGLEREYSGRPLPGTLKPSAKPQRRTEPMPEPTPAIPNPSTPAAPGGS